MRLILAIASFLVIARGSIFIYANMPEQTYDEVKWLGLVNIKVVDEKTKEVLDKDIQLITGDNTLNVKTQVLLKYGKYTFRIDGDYYEFIVNEPRGNILLEVKAPEYAKEYHIEDGDYVYDTVELSVPLIYQKPELPNGCEITSLTSLLKFYDYNVTKLEMERYLDKEPFYYKNGKRYGADPNIAFAGDPKESSGWYVFENPIIKAGNAVLEKGEMMSTTVILNHLIEGRPVIIWTTLDMSPIRYGNGWYLEDESHYKSIKNLHCIVVYGYDENDFYVMDPLQGFIKVRRELLMSSFIEMGRRAVVLFDNSNE